MTNTSSNNILGYNQQQNFNTVIQLIGLRSQPIDVTLTVLEAQDVVELEFGNAFKGLHMVWILEFLSEHSDVFRKNENYTHFLETDFNDNVFISGLTETVQFDKNIFCTDSEQYKNTYFKYHGFA